jgi:hypothetical protein
MTSETYIYKESFQVCWGNSIPLFLHAAIYLEVYLFHWTSQNAFSHETAVYKWYCVHCCYAALHTVSFVHGSFVGKSYLGIFYMPQTYSMGIYMCVCVYVYIGTIVAYCTGYLKCSNRLLDWVPKYREKFVPLYVYQHSLLKVQPINMSASSL